MTWGKSFEILIGSQGGVASVGADIAAPEMSNLTPIEA